MACHFSVRRTTCKCTTALWLAALAFFLPSTFVSGAPFGLPPLPEDPLLSKIAPKKCLFYCSWAGSAEPNEKSENQFEQLLAEKEVRYMFDKIGKVLDDALISELLTDLSDPESRPVVQEGIKVVKTLITLPGAVYISDIKSSENEDYLLEGALVINMGEKKAELEKKIRKLFALLEKSNQAVKGKDALLFKEVIIGGTTWQQGGKNDTFKTSTMTWGFWKQYFVVAFGDRAIESFLARTKGKPPAWLTGLRKKLPVKRVSMVTYFNFQKLLDFEPIVSDLDDPTLRLTLKILGLDKVQYWAGVSGFGEKRFVSKNLLATDGRPGGLLSIVQGKPLKAKDLAPIPKDTVFALAGRVDAKKLMLRMLQTYKQLDAEGAEELIEELEKLESILGFSIADDLLGSLGDVWCIYDSAVEGGGMFLGTTLMIQVRDRKRLAQTLQKLMLAAKASELVGGSNTVTFRQHQFEGKTIYYTSIGIGGWCLTDDQLIISLFPQEIKSYLSRDPGSGTLADVPEIAGVLSKSGGPTMLFYQDTRGVFRFFYPMLKYLGVGVSMMDEVFDVDVDIDIMALPSSTSIAKHLSPDVTTIVLTDAGIEIENRSSLPIPGRALVPLYPILMGGGALVQSYDWEPANFRVQELNFEGAILPNDERNRYLPTNPDWAPYPAGPNLYPARPYPESTRSRSDRSGRRRRVLIGRRRGR